MKCLLLILVATLLTACSRSPRVVVDSQLVIEFTPTGVKIGNRSCGLPCRPEQLYEILGSPTSHSEMEGGGYTHTWDRFGLNAMADKRDIIYIFSVVYETEGYWTKSIYPGRVRLGDDLLGRDTHLDSLPLLGFKSTTTLPDYKYRLERQIGKMTIAAQASFPKGDHLVVIDSFTPPSLL